MIDNEQLVNNFRDLIRNENHPESFGRHLKHACVFLLLCDLDDDPSILAILKADNKDYPWANQVALPGGHVDLKDASPKDTAYRELFEEMDITHPHVDFIGSMGFFQTINSTEIEVFTGVWDGVEKIRFDTAEIARVVKIPIIDIVQTHEKKGFHGRIPGYDELMYPVEDVVVWGATARILHYFIELLFSYKFGN